MASGSGGGVDESGRGARVGRRGANAARDDAERSSGRECHGVGSVGCLHLNGALHLYAGCAFAHVDGRTGYGLVYHDFKDTACGPGRGGLVAPDVLGELGMVDEGVAVSLDLCHGVVALCLTAAHGVLSVPFKEKVYCPGLEEGEVVAGEHVGVPRRGACVVACRHVEICACEVALVFVVGFENGAAVSGESRRAQSSQGFHGAGAGECCAARAFAVGVVASLAVDLAVGGIEVVKVGVHRRRVVEPALRE